MLRIVGTHNLMDFEGITTDSQASNVHSGERMLRGEDAECRNDIRLLRGLLVKKVPISLELTKPIVGGNCIGSLVWVAFFLMKPKTRWWLGICLKSIYNDKDFID